METLTVEWIDPRGKYWNLTTGDEGILLDLGQEGFGLPEPDHQFIRGGSTWAGVHIANARPTLKLLVGWNRTGNDWYLLHEEWWASANSFRQLGTLRVTRPDGEVRELRCRLRAHPNAAFVHDPGTVFAGDSEKIQGWFLEGESPYWSGIEQVAEFGRVTLGGTVTRNDTPFFGTGGKGFPLYISEPTLEVLEGQTATFSNRGQADMWLTWELVGPLNNPQFGLPEHTLSYRGRISAGETVVVTTQLGARSVIRQSDKANIYTNVTGRYAPLPVGEDLTLVAKANGTTVNSKMRVYGRPQYLQPF